MKFTPEVIAALATLRDAAENDFERHRLDVLERDLSAPPAVEVIDDKHQRFNGMIYVKRNDGHFNANTVAIHRAVWSYHYGEIPDGNDIHHVDNNKANNDITNLQSLTRAEHRKIHNSQYTTKEYICEVCGKKFYSANTRGVARFCSQKCRADSYILPDNRFEFRQCEGCGKTFRALKNRTTRFCSRSCSAKHSAQAVKKYPQDKICPICGNRFLVTATNSLQVCCSRECGHKYSGLKATKYPREKICPVCGVKFSPSNSRSTCCSISCAAKLREQKKRDKNNK